MEHSLGAQTIVWGDSIRQQYDSIVRFLAKVGYEGVETGMRHFDPANPSKYRELFRETGVKPLAVHVGGKFWDPSQAEEELRKIHEALLFASQVGFSYLVTSGNPQETPESARAAAETYARIGAQCRSKGVRFAYHNHNWELKEDARILRELVKHTNPEDVSFVLDVAWAYRAKASLETLFRLLSGRIAYLHVKDVKNDQFCELGTGEIPMDTVIRWAGQEGVKWLVVEQDTTTLSPEESMRVNYQYLRGTV